jgi:hypothetical protein
MTDHSTRITIEWDGEWWTISDEGGEFARATHTHQALAYVHDLMNGPPTFMTLEMLGSSRTTWEGT